MDSEQISSCSDGHSEQETTESPTPSQKELPGEINSSERIVKVTSYEERSTRQIPPIGPSRSGGSFSSQIEIQGIRPRSFSPSFRIMMSDPFFSPRLTRRIPRMIPSFIDNHFDESAHPVIAQDPYHHRFFKPPSMKEVEQYSTSGYASCSSSSSLPEYHQSRRDRDCQSDDSRSVTSDRTLASPPPDSVATAISESVATDQSKLSEYVKQKPERREYLKQSLVKVLDEMDARVTFLRETANELEEEKDKLLTTLKAIEGHNKLELIEEIDREEMIATTSRLLMMLQTVTVSVQTRRNEEQEAALKSVNAILDSLEKMFNSPLIPEREEACRRCQTFYNTCSTTSDSRVVIDENFLKQIIACTADDQKRIRKRLRSMLRDYVGSSCPSSPASSC